VEFVVDYLGRHLFPCTQSGKPNSQEIQSIHEKGTISGPFPHSYILPAQNLSGWSDDMIIELPNKFVADIQVVAPSKGMIATIFNEMKMIVTRQSK
jgi:hypothetical protein